MSNFTINRVVLVGRLTRDPQLRVLPSGASVCGLRIACSSSRKDAGGEYRPKPNYFDVSAFGRAAESVGRYVRKGSRVAIDGRLDWREWESSDGRRHQAVSIVADIVQFLDSPSYEQRRQGQSESFVLPDGVQNGSDDGRDREHARQEAGATPRDVDVTPGEADEEVSSEPIAGHDVELVF